MRATDLSPPSDAALAAIAEAHRLIGRADVRWTRLDQNEKKETPALPDPRSRMPFEMSSRSSRLMLRSLAGLLTLTCIGVAVFARQSSHGQIALEPAVTSSVSIKKEEAPIRPSPNKPDLAATTKAVSPEPQPQATVQPAPTVTPIAPEMVQQIQTIARELANVEHGIDQLKAQHSQIVQENTELTEHLNATLEITRHNADLIGDIRTMQSQMARDNGNLAGQLKASQDLIAGIAAQLKESQEQVARVGVPDQKQRPRTLVSSPLAIANSTRRAVPTSPVSPTPPASPIRARTQDASYLRPKPQ
ncbi:hypothetical protein [Bradyrhizobium sp.]|jgi:uncharacterized membrane-anchored protein YhcB (DUF1043 family)|uniref:hypothetical protein n=1 Tax=Bradyrhizobium sp. TaxID=376 RepID=UPI003C24D97C